MRNPKITLRIFASMLALILIGAGAVPAFSACFDGCSCHKQDKAWYHAHQSFRAVSHKLDVSVFRNLNPYRYSLIEPSGQHPACETVPMDTCGMMFARPVGLHKRTTSGVVQSDHPFPESILQIICQTVEGENLIPDAKRWLSTGVLPVPLYLINLSLIC